MAPDPEVDTLFVGEVFCDLVFGGVPGLPAPGGEVYAEQFQVSAGGTATRSVASARLGLRTALVGTVGDDMFGHHIIGELGSVPHLDLRWLRRDPAVRTPVTVAVADSSDRSFITYEEPEARYPEVWSGALPFARAVHIGVGRPFPDWVRQLRSMGALVVGGANWDPTGAWAVETLDRLGDVDVLVLNAVEAMAYTRAGTVEDAAAALADRVPQVVVTDGPDGAVGIDTTGGPVRVRAPRVAVADPTGAGDVFTSAFIYALLAAWPLRTRLRFASMCASWSVRTLGGASSTPTWSDVSAFLDDSTDATAYEQCHELIGSAAALAAARERI